MTEWPEKCVEWPGSRDSDGYGRVPIPHGNTQAAHRLFYTMFIGPIADGLHVLHACDNPPCINPRHLWLGTVSDNARDRETKGRGYKGGNGNRLPDEVRRAILECNEPCMAFCARLGISKTTYFRLRQAAGLTNPNPRRGEK